jgi:hypothetical protein
MDGEKTDITEVTCATCGNPVHGTFCSSCGEKVLSEKDHSLWHFVLEWFELFFHFDTKLLRTLKLLVFKPGFLTKEYWTGRRRTYMRPFQLLILLNVVYFFSSALAAHWGYGARVMFPTIEDLLGYRIYSHWLSGVVQDKLHADHISWDTYQQAFDAHLEQLAKSLVVLLVPLLALFLQLLYIRTKKLFLDHLIAAFHLVSFYIFFWSIFILLVAASIRISVIAGHPFQGVGIVGYIPMVVLIVYVFLALRRMYHESFLLELIGTLALILVGIHAITQVYDLVLFWITYAIV